MSPSFWNDNKIQINYHKASHTQHPNKRKRRWSRPSRTHYPYKTSLQIQIQQQRPTLPYIPAAVPAAAPAAAPATVPTAAPAAPAIVPATVPVAAPTAAPAAPNSKSQTQ
jgi:hypothetical protein